MKTAVLITILCCVVGCSNQYNAQGYDSNGYNWWGYDRHGFDRHGSNFWGQHRDALKPKQGEYDSPIQQDANKCQKEFEDLNKRKTEFFRKLSDAQVKFYLRVELGMSDFKKALSGENWQTFMEILAKENSLENQAQCFKGNPETDEPD